MITNYANKVMDYEYNLFMSLMHVSVSKHLFDEHFTVLWANSYFYELIGYPKDEYEDLFHNHVDEYFAEYPGAVEAMTEVTLDAYNRNESGYEFECCMPVKGGGTAWIRVTGRFTDELYEGIPVIYTLYTDITDLKNMQLALEERSKELRNALKMAEMANQAKSDFLSRMSHDIRTPMNAIIGMTEIASDHLDNPQKVNDCLKKISLSSAHLLGLINDVLDMSKIESGKMTLNNDIMHLPDILENIVAIIQPNLKTKCQQFSVRLHNVKHEIFLCDSLRLRQVFINILSNASKFTDANGLITLDVEELHSDQAQTALFKFVFSDSGIGMKPEFIEHLFDAFTREQDSRVDQTEGSGLGMAITKKIVDMLGGSIKVDSQVGKGTTFTLILPLIVYEKPLADVVSLPDLNIMIVDDDEIMCEYMMQMLKELGVHGDHSSSSADAVKKIIDSYEKGPGYDAVILDWQMPKQNGLQTARAIREQIQEKLPILIISAYDWSDIVEDAQVVGIDGFLTKPLFPSTLSRGLQKYVLHQNIPLFRQEQQYDFSNKTFLLVEDNELNREIAIELLSAMGASVEYCCDGAQSITKFNQSPEHYYDLILMDVQMPVMDGYTATRKIRELSRKDARTVPILAMTADAFTEDIVAAKESGMNGHLSKPLDISIMKYEINKLINGPTAR